MNHKSTSPFFSSLAVTAGRPKNKVLKSRWVTRLHWNDRLGLYFAPCRFQIGNAVRNAAPAFPNFLLDLCNNQENDPAWVNPVHIIVHKPPFYSTVSQCYPIHSLHSCDLWLWLLSVLSLAGCCKRDVPSHCDAHHPDVFLSTHKVHSIVYSGTFYRSMYICICRTSCNLTLLRYSGPIGTALLEKDDWRKRNPRSCNYAADSSARLFLSSEERVRSELVSNECFKFTFICMQMWR